MGLGFPTRTHGWCCRDWVQRVRDSAPGLEFQNRIKILGLRLRGSFARF